FYFFLSSSQPSHTHSILHSFPTRRSSDLEHPRLCNGEPMYGMVLVIVLHCCVLLLYDIASLHKRHHERNRSGQLAASEAAVHRRSEEHTSELQSRVDLVCRLLLEKKKKKR